MLSRLFGWVIENPETTGLLIGFLISTATLIYKMGWAGIYAGIQKWIHIAERRRRQGDLPFDGPQIFEWVVAQVMLWVVPAAPAWLKPYLTEARVRLLVQQLFDKGMDLIDDGKLNGSTGEAIQSPASQVAATNENPPADPPGTRSVR